MDTGELILVPLSLTSIRWISKCICPNCKIYLSKFKHVFVQISECICPNSNMYLSIYNWGHGHWGAHICSTLSFLLHLLNINNIKLLLLFLLSIYKMYLSKFLNVFVQIGNLWTRRAHLSSTFSLPHPLNIKKVCSQNIEILQRALCGVWVVKDNGLAPAYYLSQNALQPNISRQNIEKFNIH